MATEVTRLARLQWYEDAARVRDEGDRLRHLMGQHRRVESLRQAGRVVLFVDGEGPVELDGGLLAETGSLFGSEEGRSEEGRSEEGRSGAARTGGVAGGPSGLIDTALTMTKDGHEHERVIVAQWLHAHPERVRVLEVESPDGISLPADRIPRFNDLCGQVRNQEALAS
jgi:hypothetical protein